MFRVALGKNPHVPASTGLGSYTPTSLVWRSEAIGGDHSAEAEFLFADPIEALSFAETALLSSFEVSDDSGDLLWGGYVVSAEIRMGGFSAVVSAEAFATRLYFHYTDPAARVQAKIIVDDSNTNLPADLRKEIRNAQNVWGIWDRVIVGTEMPLGVAELAAQTAWRQFSRIRMAFRSVDLGTWSQEASVRVQALGYWSILRRRVFLHYDPTAMDFADFIRLVVERCAVTRLGDNLLVWARPGRIDRTGALTVPYSEDTTIYAADLIERKMQATYFGDKIVLPSMRGVFYEVALTDVRDLIYIDTRGQRVFGSPGEIPLWKVRAGSLARVSMFPSVPDDPVLVMRAEYSAESNSLRLETSLANRLDVMIANFGLRGT
jgi:hypothetical protein